MEWEILRVISVEVTDILTFLNRPQHVEDAKEPEKYIMKLPTRFQNVPAVEAPAGQVKGTYVRAFRVSSRASLSWVP